MSRTTVARYVAAVGVSGAAFAVEWMLRPWVGPELTPVFMLPVLWSALVGGLGPAMVATACCAVGAAYFMEPSGRSFDLGWDDALRIMIFVAVAVVVSGLGDYRRRSAQRLSEALGEADRANRAKDRFLAILSHELRTPLNPVLLTASSVERDEGQPADVREAMGVIRQNVEVQTRIIDDLLDLTRIENGKLSLRHEAVDVRGLLRRTVQIVRAEAEAKGLRLVAELGASGCRVWADGGRLQQVFWNLAKNAIKFTPAGGTVRVSVSCDERAGVVRVRVNDTGMGIEPALLERLFRPFEQGGEATTARFGGLGLGLNISKGLVELQGGTLEAASEGRGKGATFTVTLPMMRRQAEEEEETVGGPGAVVARESPRGLRILLIEDHEPTARVLAKLLRGRGHSVRTAGNVRGALDVAAEERFDLVVSDLGLPDGSGLEVMRELRGATRNRLRGIALSGYGMEADLRASREAGFAEHLVKPVDLTTLERAIERVVG